MPDPGSRLRSVRGSPGVVLRSGHSAFIGVGIVCLVVALAAPAARADTFTGPTFFPTGLGPQSVAAADFNGDSDPDLAVANSFSNTVSILLGAAGGGFTAATDFPAASNPVSVAVGDFNADADADPDLALASGSGLSILLGAAGGSFTAPTSYPAGGNQRSVAVGDFNADTDPDLVVVNQADNNVSILLGAAGGSFTGFANFAVGLTPTSVAVGDFNGDADPDLAVSTANFAPGVSILLGAAGASFTGPTNFATAASPQSVAVGDFNGDTDPDLVTANASSTNVSILLGAAGGSFSGPTNFAAGPTPGSVAVGDFNGDTDPDLVVANYVFSTGTVSILVGGAGGAFSLPTSFVAGSQPRSIAVDDFNADTVPDLATANEQSNNVSILLGAPSSLVVNNDSAAEGDSGSSNLTFTVFLQSRSYEPVTVDYHTEDGSANAGSDYVATSGSLTFAPGELSKTVTVAVNGDFAFEPDEFFNLVLSDPTNAVIAVGSGIGTIQNDDQLGYSRPKAATPVRTPLVPAYRKCNDPDRVHAPTLEYQSCSLPMLRSEYLTVGTPDANGAAANAEGYLTLAAIPGNPETPADEADVNLSVSASDVRGNIRLADYIAELWATVSVRITDRLTSPQTVTDFSLGFAIPCTATPDTTVGATCSASTTADAVLPGSVPEGSRAIWQLGEVQVQDGGEDGEGATTADNTLFLKQGIFTP